MAAIAWGHLEDRNERLVRRPGLRLVTSPPSRRRPSAAVYRRRRLVALVVTAVLTALLWQAVGALLPASSAAAGAPVAEPTFLVAAEGDSYWSLAASIHAGGDIRSTVDALVDANGGRDLRAGDRILVPAR